MEEKKARIFVDLNYLLKHFERCKAYEIVVPKVCVEELKMIIKKRREPETVAYLTSVLNYLKENAEIAFERALPKIPVHVIGLKTRSYVFARYAIWACEKYPGIRVMTMSREVKCLLRANNVPMNKRP